MALGNVRGPVPGAGFLTDSPLWEVTEMAADSHSAHVTKAGSNSGKSRTTWRNGRLRKSTR